MAYSGAFNTTSASGMYLAFDWWQVKQDIAGCYTDISFNLISKGGTPGYYISSGPFSVTVNGELFNNSNRISMYPDMTIISGSKRIYHDGTTGNATLEVSCSAAIYTYAQNVWGSGSWNLEKIPRYATMTNAISSFTDEQNPWFQFSNPAKASIECWLEPNPNGDHLCKRTLTGAQLTSGKYEWELTEDERKQLRAHCTGNSCKVRIGLYSTIGGHTEPSYLDKTMTIVNANPTFTNFDYNVIDDTSINLTGNNITVIRGISDIVVYIPDSFKAISKKEATMVKYRFQCGEQQEEVEADADFLRVEFDSIYENSISVYAIDSRGNSTLVKKAITDFINYKHMDEFNVNFTATRGNGGVSKEVSLHIDGEFWNGYLGSVRPDQDGNNHIKSITYEYRRTNSSIWKTGTTIIAPTEDGKNYSFNGIVKGDAGALGFELDYSYVIRIRILDRLSMLEAEYILQSAAPAMAIHRLGVSFGEPYDANEGGPLQIEGVDIRKYFGVPKLLYFHQGKGEQTTIYMSDSAEEYDFIDVYFRRYSDEPSANRIASARFYQPNHKYCTLSMNHATGSSNTLQIYGENIYFDDDEIVRIYSCMAGISGNSVTQFDNRTNEGMLYIYRVLGYKLP